MSTYETNAPLLEIRGLTKEFRQGKDRVMAVHEIGLDIQKGEVFGLVGESGCGKSTFGNMLVHLLEPSSGTIRLNGVDITRPARRQRKDLCKQMQIVFQDPYSSIDPNKTIGWLVEEPLKIHGIGKTQKERDEKVSQVLKAVGLDESYRTRWPNELSGGQRQRVAIAIALILDPDFVVCDEPVSALDVSVHISQMPLHPYTQARFSASMDVDADRDRIILSGDLPSPAHPPAGCPFHTRCFACTERCKTEKPLLRQFEGGRYCACHLVEERTGLKPVEEPKLLEEGTPT